MTAKEGDSLVARCRLYRDRHEAIIAELESMSTRYQRGEFLRRLLELGFVAWQQPAGAVPTAMPPSSSPSSGSRDALPASVNQALLDNLDLETFS